MLSPFVIARPFAYWKFPSSTDRIAYVAIEGEVSKVAWQASDDTFWVLIDYPGTWVQLGSGGISSNYLPNVISVPTTIPADYSAVVVSYLILDEALTVDGNLLIAG